MKLGISITLRTRKKTSVSELSGNRATRYTRRVAFNNDGRQLLLFPTLISLEVGFEKDRKPMRPKKQRHEKEGEKVNGKYEEGGSQIH